MKEYLPLRWCCSIQHFLQDMSHSSRALCLIVVVGYDASGGGLEELHPQEHEDAVEGGHGQYEKHQYAKQPRRPTRCLRDRRHLFSSTKLYKHHELQQNQINVNRPLWRPTHFQNID